MTAVLDSYRTAFSFVAVLGMLIFFHELGHLLAARWRGVRVERFSIGFGHAIACWTDKRQTEWRVGWIPLGGYVRLHGHYGPAKHDPHPGQMFHDKPVLDRTIVVLAGPIANLLLATVLFMGIFAFNGKPYVQPVISAVVEGSPAAAAGLRAGDRVVEVDGMPVTRFEAFQELVRNHPHAPLPVVVLRGEDRISLTATPEERHARSGEPLGWLGISGGVVGWQQMPPAHALAEAVMFTGETSARVVGALAGFVTGSREASDLGGPIRIAQMSGEVASSGIMPLFGFIAFMSINLAIMNLLPIPGLDGGYLLFYAIEAVRGRPLSPRATDAGMRIGMAALFSFMAWTTVNDLVGVGFFGWLLSFVS